MSEETSFPASDPQGYYAALGVGPLADAHEITAAYRQQAKILHPDFNPADDASAEFQRIVEAYRVLRDGRRRQAYDASAKLPAPLGLIDPDDPTPQPLKCSRCGKVTAQPRYLVIHRVKSYLVKCQRSVIHGIFCRDCADRTVLRASTATWIQGWWSPTGPIHTVRALWRNLRGGDKPKPDNLWVLLHQARAFLHQGDNDVARALADQARAFAKDHADRQRINAIADMAGTSPRKLIDRWAHGGHAAWVQAMPLLALSLAGCLAVLVVLFRAQTDSVSAAITVRPAQAGETRHVAVEVLKVREGPAPTQPVVALLDRFATVQVMDSVGEGEWARILTPNGVSGYVPSRFLFGGPGNVQKSRWCSDQKGPPPASGDVLMRRTGGDHLLTIDNATGQDVVVRLKTSTGRTLVTFFVAAESEVTVDGIPDGTFRAVFATGQDYSRACGVFLQDMRTFIVPTAQQFNASLSQGQSQLALHLPPVGEAPGQSHSLPLESFLDN